MKRSLIATLLCVALLLGLASCAAQSVQPSPAPPEDTAPLENNPDGYKALFKERYEAAWALAQHYVCNGCAEEGSVSVTDENGLVWRPCDHYSSIEELKAATLEIFTDATEFFRVAFEGDLPAYKEEDGILWQNKSCLFDVSPWLGDTLTWEGQEIEFLQWDTLTVKNITDDTITYTIDVYLWYPGDPTNVSFILLKGDDGIWRFDHCFEETAPAAVENLALQYLSEDGQETKITRMWRAGRYNDIADYTVEAYALEWQVKVMNQGQLKWISSSFCNDVSYLIFSRMGEDYAILGAKAVPDGGDSRKAAIEAVYGLDDLDFSVCLDNCVGFWGLGGNDIEVFSADFSEQRLDYDVYHEGDYWFRRSYPGLSLFCYFSAESNLPYIYSMEFMRNNLATYRGIKVGDSREDVLNTYPEIQPEHFPAEEWGDQLVYESMPEAICGYFLHFYFENDQVVRIMIENMFD